MPPEVDQLREALQSQYTIERELGRGGMATVFLAHDLRHNRKVAIKVLYPELSSALGPNRFLQEIAVTAALQHPNILPLFDSGRAGDLLYYVMPYVEGETLRDRIRRGPLSPAESLSILKDIVRALAYAHAHGVIHRDVKPENVLLSGGVAVVADFGISKAVDTSRTANGSAFTATGIQIGTPGYMAPEQAVGDPVDHRADLYAWSVIAYELLSGAHPFADKQSTQQLVAAHLTETPAALAADGSVGAGVTTVVMRGLAKSPNERPPNADQILVSLDTSTGSREATPPRPSRRVAAGVVGALLLAVVAVLVVRSRNAASSGTNAHPRSLAVLPFANIGDVKENELLADGMTEDVIAQLVMAGDLTVISRTAVSPYKGTSKPIRQVARELGVDRILEGSVRRIGSRVRVVANLLDGEKEAPIWGETFDREFADVFVIQAELARAIADTLRASLSPLAKSRLAQRHSIDTLVYQRYLEGRAALAERTADGLTRAFKNFEEAIRIDSMYAPAYAGLAETYRTLPFMAPTGLPGRDDPLRRARATVDVALRLDPNLPEARATSGLLLTVMDHRWSAAEDEFKRALLVSPGNASVHLGYATLLNILGRHDEAAEEARRAAVLEPVVPSTMHAVAMDLSRAGRDGEALDLLERVHTLDASFAGVWPGIYTSAWAVGKTDEAFDALEKWEQSLGVKFVTAADLKGAMNQGGRTAVLRLLRDRWPASGPFLLLHARWLVELGDVAGADAVMATFAKNYASAVPMMLGQAALRDLRKAPQMSKLLLNAGLTP